MNFLHQFAESTSEKKPEPFGVKTETDWRRVEEKMPIVVTDSRVIVGSVSWWILIGLLIGLFGICIYLFSQYRMLKMKQQLIEQVCYKKGRMHPNNEGKLKLGAKPDEGSLLSSIQGILHSS